MGLSNTLLGTIYEEYHALFELTRKALKPLAKATGKDIPDDEMAYFTILFGGAMKAESDERVLSENIRSLIVCPNGVSSSLILESELKQLFPSMAFKGVSTTEGVRNIPEEAYDVIFSTVPIREMTKKVYVVNPIMSQLMKNQLINEVQKDWLIPGFSFPDAEEIIEAMKPYVTLNDGVTEEQLYRILNRKIHREFGLKEEKPRLSDLLTADNILFREKVYRYEDAIRIAANPLLEKRMIDETYIEAMIENVQRRGPYIFLGHGMALPHARPEDGVNEVGFSMLVLKEPIALAEDSNVFVDHFIVLAAVDNSTHLDALSDLNGHCVCF